MLSVVMAMRIYTCPLWVTMTEWSQTVLFYNLSHPWIDVIFNQQMVILSAVVHINFWMFKKKKIAYQSVTYKDISCITQQFFYTLVWILKWRRCVDIIFSWITIDLFLHHLQESDPARLPRQPQRLWQVHHPQGYCHGPLWLLVGWIRLPAEGWCDHALCSIRIGPELWSISNFLKVLVKRMFYFDCQILLTL